MSNAERQKRYRDSKRNAPVTESVSFAPHGVTRVTAEPERVASLEDYYDASTGEYAKRAIPELLNWGPWMIMAALEQAGLKANRVPIPGDWDYEGAV